MCCVMPPASPATTLVWRMASSSDVLPWSTWPMMVTTGARGSSVPSSSFSPMKPVSTSASDTRLGVWPNSCTISSAVSASITSLILCIAPCFIRILDDVDGALGHAVGQLLDGDDLGDHHFAHDLLARLLNAHRLELLALALALQRGQRALALLLVEGVVDGQLDALALLVRLGRRRARGARLAEAPWGRRGCRLPRWRRARG